MLAEIQDILIVTTPASLSQFQSLLGDGSRLGLNISYIEQLSPDGLAQALILGEKYLNGSPCCLVLGDNIFYGDGLKKILIRAKTQLKGATIFACKVRYPEQFGVVEFADNKVVSLQEKPKFPRSQFAVTGLYFYNEKASELAKMIKPSARGELEITDLNKLYLAQGHLNVELLGRGFAWLDTGTYASLMSAGQFVQTIEERQGHKIACLEEIAFINRWISESELEMLINTIKENDYRKYLKTLIND